MIDLEYKKEQLSIEDSKILTQFIDEFSAMSSARKDHEQEWETSERQFDAELEQEWNQRASIKLQITRNIIEQQIWEEWLSLPIKVKPEWKNADSYMLDTAKYLVDYYIRKEEIIDEIVDFKVDRAITWTWILESWIWTTICVNNVPNWEWSIYNTGFKQDIKTKYHIWIRNVSIWDIWFDETATKISNIRRCIRRERMDIVEFRKTFSKKPWFKYIESVTPMSQDLEDPTETNKDIDTTAWEDRNVFLFHYYNEITWDYRIIANRQYPIYVGKNIFKNSQIPFDICQQYKNPKSIYGKWVWYKTRSHESYMNNLFEIALDKVYMTSTPPLILGNNGEIDWEIYSGGWDIPILNFNGDVKNIQQLQMDWRIDANKFAMDMSKDEIIQNTWVNPWEYNKPLSWINPFVAWLQEQSKKAKLILWQFMFESTLSKAFTKMLNNLMVYWPVLYWDIVEKVVDWKALKDVKYADIQVIGKEVKQKKKKLNKDWKKIDFTEKIEYEDNPWNYWTFEFNDTVFKTEDLEYPELSVYIETPSTKTLLEALKKEEFNSYMNNLVAMQKLYPDKPLPISQQELYELMSEIYWYDVDEIQMRTETDKLRKEASDILWLLQELNPANLQSNIIPNAEQNPAQTMIWASQNQPLWWIEQPNQGTNQMQPMTWNEMQGI